MKRIKTIAVVLFSALLCFAVTAMAKEASFYDTTNLWIVRAFTFENASPGTYSIYLDIVDGDTGNEILLSEILVNGETPTGNPFLISDDEVSDAISLAYKYVSGGTDLFVFGTHVQGQLAVLHNNTIISRNNPVPPANISVSGNGVFGEVDVDATPPTRAITVSNTGVANLLLGDIAVTGTGFSQVAGGCTDGQTLAQGQNCIITVQFDPTAEGAYVGNLSIPSNDSDTPTASVTLSGTGDEASPSGTSDITFPAYIGMSGPSTIDNGKAFYMTVRVVNNGTQATGAFPLKLYFSLDRTPGNTGDILLGTWNVSNLNPGQTLTYTFYNLVVSGAAIHQNYYVISHADPDNAVGETNEGNNLFYRTVSVAR